MEVYIEYVIIDNLIIDGIILYLTEKFTKDKVVWWKILSGAIVGTIFSVFSPYISLNKPLFLLAKFLLSVLMVSLARCKFKGLFRAILLFYLLTFTFGGVIIGLFYLVNIDFQTANELYYLLNFPIGILVGGVFLCIFLVVYGYRYSKKRRAMSTYIYDIEVFYKDKSKKLVGFLDSGNFLTDKVTGKPVLVTSIKSVMNLLENVDFSSLDKMKCSSISSKSEILRLFEVDKLVIYDGKKENIHNN
ncbi:MAG: sigma-E processing peptidase SpoIIGA, partial [Clostridia bacterium]